MSKKRPFSDFGLPENNDKIILATDKKTGESQSVLISGDGTSKPLSGDCYVMEMHIFDKPVPIPSRLKREK